MKQTRSFCSLLLVFVLMFPALPAAASGAAPASFPWSAAQSVEVGDTGGLVAPALSFTDGRAGLETGGSDLVVSQENFVPYVYSNSGGLLDVGAVDFDKVPPLSGNYAQKVPAVAGHVYLFQNADGTRYAKFILTQVVKGARGYSTPTVYLNFAQGTVGATTSLQAFGSVDLGVPGGGRPVAVNWGQEQIVAMGDVGGLGEPTLNLITGKTGLYDSSTNVVLDQQNENVVLTSQNGGFLDLGAVLFAKASPVTGNYTAQVPAVQGHVYLYQAGSLIARIQLLQVIPGEGRRRATAYLRFTAGTLDAAAVLPPTGSVDMGQQSTGQTGFTWGATTLKAMGNTGGIVSPAFNVTSGNVGLTSSAADISVGQDNGAVWMESERGALIDLGAVSLSKVVPLTGVNHWHIAAVPGHVYFYQAGTTVAKLQLTQVVPATKSGGTPRLIFVYASGTINPDNNLPDASSLDLGGWTGATVGAWSCLQSVTVGRVNGVIANALSFSTGQTGLSSSMDDLLVEQKDSAISLHTYNGGFLDLGAFDIAKVPPLTGTFANSVIAVPGHVYLYQSGISVVKFQVVTAVPASTPHGVPVVTLHYAATTVGADTVLGQASSFDPNTATATPLTACPAPAPGPGPSPNPNPNPGPTPNPNPGPGSDSGNGPQSAAPSHALVFQLGNQTAMVDGQKKQLDVAPQLVNGRTMVPLRALGEALGAKVEWDGATRKVTYTLGDLNLQLWVDQTGAVLNGQTKVMDVPPTIVNGRTLIPLRFASENLGANVKYDGSTKSVGVASGEAAAALDKRPAPKESEQTPGADAPQVPEPKKETSDRKHNPTVAYAIQDTTRLVKVDLQTGLFSTVFETIAGIYHFRLNPAGDAVAYEDGSGRLILRSLDSGSETVLYTPINPAMDLEGQGREGTRRYAGMPWSFSPDGQSVMFLTLGAFDSTPSLMTVPVSGGDPSSVGTGFDAAWSDAGVSAGDGTALRLYPDVSLAGGRELDYRDSSGDSPVSLMASFSANGEYLAYVGRDGSDLYLYDVNSDNSKVSLQDTDIAQYSFPRAGNDGSTVLTAKLGDLWLVTPDGRRQVTQAGDITNPDW